MCRTTLTVAAVALAVVVTAPAFSGESGGRWSIDRGGDAANVTVSVAPQPESRAAAEPGCEQPSSAAGTQYSFPTAQGVTVYVNPGYGGYMSPFGFGYGGGYGVPYGSYGYSGAATPQIIVWARQGGAAY